MIQFNCNKIQLIDADITTLEVDCIVNAANSSLLGGGGVDGAIHRAAGQELALECSMLGGCKVGEAKITRAYALKAKRVIHTVGPHYEKDDPALLANCYENSLNLAKEYGLKSIAFPCISTGIFAYPYSKAAKVAMETIEKWCMENPDYGMEIIICCYGPWTYNAYLPYFA